jgi:hypothetical protein
VPRKPKKNSKETVAPDGAAAPLATGPAAPDAAKPRVAKGRKTPTARPKKATAPRVTKTASKPQRAQPTASANPTDEQIQLRAYFIAERRHRLQLAGDANSDWIEARRQLVAEASAH